MRQDPSLCPRRLHGPAAGAARAACLALAVFPACALAQNQTWVPAKGHGSVSVAYQDLFIATHTISDGSPGYPGTISTRSLFLTADYGLTDRFAINVSLPYKSSRFVGPGVHDPGTLDDDHGESFIDDGDYHGGWQDLRVSLRYLWLDGPYKVVPFIAYGTPTHDYSTFAHAALGTGQNHLQFGVNVGHGFAPPAQNLYWLAGLSYSVMEKVEDRRVNHGTLNLEMGYFFTPRLSASVLVTAQKTWNGFDYPGDYPNAHDEHFYPHDQNLRNDFVNVGAVLGFQFDERYSAFVSYGHTVWGENTHLIDHAWTMGVTRSF